MINTQDNILSQCHLKMFTETSGLLQIFSNYNFSNYCKKNNGQFVKYPVSGNIQQHQIYTYTDICIHISLMSIQRVNNSISFKFEIFSYVCRPFIFLIMATIYPLSIFTRGFRLLYVTECSTFSPFYYFFLILYLLSATDFKYLHKYFIFSLMGSSFLLFLN